MTVPTTMSGDFLEGNACIALDLRFISRLARSCMLLARSLFRDEVGESRCVSASGSVSSDTLAALPHTVAHQAHGASLPCRFPEDLFYSPVQALVGIGCNELCAVGAVVALRLQELEPRVIRLRVHHRYVGHAPPAGLILADGLRHGGRCCAVSLDVGRVKPDVGYRAHFERLLRQVCYLGVEARDDCAHAVPAEPLDTHLGGDPLCLPCVGSGGVNLGHRRDDGLSTR